MKLLFDQNISFRITKLVNEFSPGCKHVSHCGLMDCEDPEIWQYAKSNNYAIVTFDSDFFEISLIKGHPPKIIWVRTGNLAINSFLNSKDFQNVSCLELD